jgi:hypothetical protein
MGKVRSFSVLHVSILCTCLCCRYDINNAGSINGEKLMQKLGISIMDEGKEPPRMEEREWHFIFRFR